jgi:hypothetical protein
MKSKTRWFVLPRFGSCKPTPHWGGHKDQVSFNPLPLSNGHLDRVSFSSQSLGTPSSQDHHIIGVSCLAYNWVRIKKERRRKVIQAQELKWTQMSLSLVTIWLEWTLDLREDLISCLCLGMKSRALVLNANGWNLDALNVGWLGVFIAPTTKIDVGEGFCRQAPATSPGRWVPTVGALTCGATGQSGGAPDRSCRLSGAPSGACSDFCAQARTVAHLMSSADDCWHEVAVAPLAHRTVWCYTGQSSEL